MLRNLMLERVLELKGLQPGHNNTPLGTEDSSPCDIPNSKPEAKGTDLYNPVDVPADVEDILRMRAIHPPLLQYTKAQLDTLEFADYAQLWREYINRCEKYARDLEQ